MTPLGFRRAYDDVISEANGWLYFGARGDYPADRFDAANAFMVASGYRGIDRDWFDLDAPGIHKYAPGVGPKDMPGHLARLLQFDMVFPSFEDMSDVKAREIADVFYAMFNTGVRTSLCNGVGNGWNPISDWTFDRAFVAMDDLHIGAIVFLGED